MNKFKTTALFYFIILGPIVLPLGGYAWWCHAQARVWQRQGIDISTFEVMLRMHPAAKP